MIIAPPTRIVCEVCGREICQVQELRDSDAQDTLRYRATVDTAWPLQIWAYSGRVLFGDERVKARASSVPIIDRFAAGDWSPRCDLGCPPCQSSQRLAPHKLARALDVLMAQDADREEEIPVGHLNRVVRELPREDGRRAPARYWDDASRAYALLQDMHIKALPPGFHSVESLYRSVGLTTPEADVATLAEPAGGGKPA